mgnify:CR=1 FL=1
MENKYSELERLNNLKMNGTISETEFEVQKYRILNTTPDNKSKKNKSKILFIFSSISAVSTIIWGILLFVWNDTIYTELYFKYNNISLNNSVSRVLDIGLALFIITTIVLTISGIIFKVKEKGGIKIVN